LKALLERVTASLVEGRRFGSECDALSVGRAEQPAAEDAWTDAALAERLRRRDTGVILLWSPHMPLSVDAYDVLLALTRETGIDLVAILDPASDPSYAIEENRVVFILNFVDSLGGSRLCRSTSGIPGAVQSS
jgi:hypothetical protein